MATNSVSFEKHAVSGLLLRMIWLIGGSATIAVSSLYIVQHRQTLFSIADAVFWVSVPVMIAARYFDIVKFNGATSYGEPATLSHWRRYVLGLLLGGSAAWLALHAIAYLLMN